MKIKNLIKHIFFIKSAPEVIADEVTKKVNDFFEIIDYDQKNLIYNNFYKFTGYTCGFYNLFNLTSKLNPKAVSFVKFFIQKYLRRKYYHNLIDKKDFEIRHNEFELSKNAHSIKYQKYDFLFIASMNYYLNPFINFVKKCNDLKYTFAFIIPEEAKNWSNFEKIRDYDYYFIEDFYDEKIHNGFLESKHEYQLIFEEKISELKSIFNIKGIDLFSVFNERLYWFVSSFIPFSLSCEALAEKIYHHFKPEAVFMPRHRRAIDLSFIKEAEKNEIKKYMILHGNISYSPSHRVTEGHYYSADKIFCFHKFDKEIILKWDKKVNKENILNVGSPIWEKSHTIDKEYYRKKIIELFGINKNESIITHISDGNELVDDYRIVIRALRNFENIFYIFKAKSGENIEPYKKLFRDSNFRGRYKILTDNINGVDTLGLIAGSKIVLSCCSTAILDTLFANVPIVLFNFNNIVSWKIKLFEYIRQIDNPHDFALLVEKLLYEAEFYDSYCNNQKEIASQFDADKHKNASENILKIIENDIKESNRFK